MGGAKLKMTNTPKEVRFNKLNTDILKVCNLGKCVHFENKHCDLKFRSLEYEFQLYKHIHF